MPIMCAEMPELRKIVERHPHGEAETAQSDQAGAHGHHRPAAMPVDGTADRG
jgi:hypothetical protein